MALSDLTIRNAKATGRTQRLFDGDGLYLEVSPTGGKWWRLKYRIGGKEKRLSLGTYHKVGLKLARKKCDEFREMIAAGIDPSEQRKLRKLEQKAAMSASADTFEAVAREWMTRQAVARVTAEKNRWLLETFLFPEIGSRSIGEITSRELLAALRKIEATGKLETASRAKIKAGQVFRYAMLEGKTEIDPTASLRGALKSVKARHHAAITEPSKIGQLLRAIDGFNGQPVTLAALRLAPLVFVRPGELRAAEWDEIDLDAAIWRIRPERMKMKAAHLVPLSSQAVALLQELHGLTGGGSHVFPGMRPNRPMSENTINAALRALGYSGDEMTGHGFRSMAATRLNEMGWNADAIERQLAHAETNKVREAYTHAAQYLPERVSMMQAWADYLDALRNNNNVLPFKSRAG
nr:tyrosine-type recombinase/integrase [Stenotrophomonas sp. Iso1]